MFDLYINVFEIMIRYLKKIKQRNAERKVRNETQTRDHKVAQKELYLNQLTTAPQTLSAKSDMYE